MLIYEKNRDSAFHNDFSWSGALTATIVGVLNDVFPVDKNFNLKQNIRQFASKTIVSFRKTLLFPLLKEFFADEIRSYLGERLRYVLLKSTDTDW